MDILYWVNSHFIPKAERIEDKEFHNDAVNNELDLKSSMAEWAKLSKIQVRNNQPITHGNMFNLCSYHWILSPHNKTIMLQKQNKMEWQTSQSHFILSNFFKPPN
jgi:hypothetical protein